MGLGQSDLNSGVTLVLSEVATLKQTNGKSCNIIRFHYNTNAYLASSSTLHVPYRPNEVHLILMNIGVYLMKNE